MQFLSNYPASPYKCSASAQQAISKPSASTQQVVSKCSAGPQQAAQHALIMCSACDQQALSKRSASAQQALSKRSANGLMRLSFLLCFVKIEQKMWNFYLKSIFECVWFFVAETLGQNFELGEASFSKKSIFLICHSLHMVV